MLRLDVTGPTPNLYLYGTVAERMWFHDPGEVIDAGEVVELLQQVPADQELLVRINSGGGDVFQGVAIYNALAQRGKVRVQIDALAASIASVIAMAGSEIVIGGNALLMVHRAWTMAWGNADELAKVVETLAKIDQTIIGTYAARAKKSTREQIETWMKAETWMDATEAVDRGFADKSLDLQGPPEAAKVPKGWFHNTPDHLIGDEPRLQQPPRTPPDNRRQRPDADPPAQRSASCIPAIAARLREVRSRI